MRTENQRNTEGLKDDRLKKFMYIYPEDVKPVDYLESNPIMIGSWRFTDETETHWIGNLHHPSENISAGGLFMEKDFQIKKDPNLKINFRDRYYYLIFTLDKPVTMAVEQHLRKGRSMALVGYLHEKGGLGTFNDLHEDHPFEKKVVK